VPRAQMLSLSLNLKHDHNNNGHLYKSGLEDMVGVAELEALRGVILISVLGIPSLQPSRQRMRGKAGGRREYRCAIVV